MNSQTQSKAAFVFIGRSGCGKGTQAELLMNNILKQKNIPFYYLESGENFRQFIKGTGYSNTLSKKIYESGDLQPEFLAVWTWSHLLVSHLEDGQSVVLDGTPRKLREAHVLETAFDFYQYEKVNVIHLNISHEESKKRLAARGRFDDTNAAEVEKRLKWFDTDVMPAIDFYRNNPRYQFLDIDGEKTIEEVHGDIVGKLAL